MVFSNTNQVTGTSKNARYTRMLWEKKIGPITGRSDSTGMWMAEKLSI